MKSRRGGRYRRGARDGDGGRAGEAGAEGKEPGPAAADRPLPTATDAVPRPACRQAEDFFPSEPEESAGPLTQDQEESITSVNPRVSATTSAKPAQEPPARPRKREQKRPRRASSGRAGLARPRFPPPRRLRANHDCSCSL